MLTNSGPTDATLRSLDIYHKQDGEFQTKHINPQFVEPLYKSSFGPGATAGKLFQCFKLTDDKEVASLKEWPHRSKYRKQVSAFLTSSAWKWIICLVITAHVAFITAETNLRWTPEIGITLSEYFKTTWKMMVAVNFGFTVFYFLELTLAVYGEVPWMRRREGLSIIFLALLSFAADLLGVAGIYTEQHRVRDVLQTIGLFRIFRVIFILGRRSGSLVVIKGLVVSIAALVWVALALILSLYFFANMAVRFFHKGVLAEVNNGEMEFRWGSLTGSAFTLFLMLTFDGWSDVALDTRDIFPTSPSFFVVYIAVTGVVMLSVVTSALVDAYINASKALHADELYRQALEQERCAVSCLRQVLEGPARLTSGETLGDQLRKISWTTALAGGELFSGARRFSTQSHRSRVGSGALIPTIERGRRKSGLQRPSISDRLTPLIDSEKQSFSKEWQVHIEPAEEDHDSSLPLPDGAALEGSAVSVLSPPQPFGHTAPLSPSPSSPALSRSLWSALQRTRKMSTQSVALSESQLPPQLLRHGEGEVRISLDVPAEEVVSILAPGLSAANISKKAALEAVRLMQRYGVEEASALDIAEACCWVGDTSTGRQLLLAKMERRALFELMHARIVELETAAVETEQLLEELTARLARRRQRDDDFDGSKRDRTPSPSPSPIPSPVTGASQVTSGVGKQSNRDQVREAGLSTAQLAEEPELDPADEDWGTQCRITKTLEIPTEAVIGAGVSTAPVSQRPLPLESFSVQQMKVQIVPSLLSANRNPPQIMTLGSREKRGQWRTAGRVNSCVSSAPSVPLGTQSSNEVSKSTMRNSIIENMSPNEHPSKTCKDLKIPTGSVVSPNDVNHSPVPSTTDIESFANAQVVGHPVPTQRRSIDSRGKKRQSRFVGFPGQDPNSRIKNA